MSLFISPTPNMSDGTLSAKVGRGNVEAFIMVYNKYHKPLHALAYRYLVDKAMTKNTVQHIFMRFWEFRSKFRVGISLKNYFVTTTKDHTPNVIRNESNVIAENYKIAQSILEYEDTLIENLKEKGMMSLFYRVLDKLPPRKHEIYPMKVRDELTNLETAERMQLSVNTIEIRYSEALKLLHVHLHKLLMFVTYLTLLKYLSVLFILWIIK